MPTATASAIVSASHTVPMPRLKAVAQEISDAVLPYIGTIEDDELDCRLIIHSNGVWVIALGDASYDLIHGVACGAECIDLDTHDYGDSVRIARSLLDQCHEQLVVCGLFK